MDENSPRESTATNGDFVSRLKAQVEKQQRRALRREKELRQKAEQAEVTRLRKLKDESLTNDLRYPLPIPVDEEGVEYAPFAVEEVRPYEFGSKTRPEPEVIISQLKERIIRLEYLNQGLQDNQG